MIATPNIEAVRDAMVVQPNDMLARLALADLYEECGNQNFADAMRWSHKHNKRPLRCRVGESFVWIWYDEEQMLEVYNETDPQSNLPPRLFSELGMSSMIGGGVGKSYETMRDADDAFCEAFVCIRSLMELV